MHNNEIDDVILHDFIILIILWNMYIIKKEKNWNNEMIFCLLVC